jgi:hypothetical protein
MIELALGPQPLVLQQEWLAGPLTMRLVELLG